MPTFLQFPITAIPYAVTLIVSGVVSTKVFLLKRAYLKADVEVQGKISNVLKELTSTTKNGKDVILQRFFPYASKFARSVIGLFEIYVSMICKYIFYLKKRCI